MTYVRIAVDLNRQYYTAVIFDFIRQIADWLQSVPMLGLFFNSSWWCRVTMLPILYLFLTQSYHYAASILFFSMLYFLFIYDWIIFFLTHVSSVCPTARDRKTDWKFCQRSRLGVCGPLHCDKSNTTQQLLETIIIQTHFIHISA